jgi:zinc protease
MGEQKLRYDGGSMRRRRRYLGGMVLLLLALPAWGAKQSASPQIQPSAPWPQSQSDIKPDPAVRFETLPNGLRLAIMPNHMPAGQVSLRLRIDAGSVQEETDQQGLAHFIEHMAFRGSRHIADGEAFHMLERFGAAPGADSNAFTDQFETVYKIDLPKNGQDGIDAALDLLRETASEALIAEAAVESERAVVLSEERAGDTPAFRLHKAELAFVYKGQPIADRLPIGRIEVLKEAQAADLRRFYDAYYRPERATLIVTGDIVAESMAAKIRRRFGDWRGRGAAGADPQLGKPLPRGQEVESVAEPGAPTVATLEWTQDPDLRPDNKAKERDGVIAQLAMLVLNQRLQDQAHGADPPFLGARAFHRNVGRSAQLTALAMASSEEGWRRALAAGLRAKDALLRDGITQAEVERQVREWRSSLEQAAASAATRKTAGLADALVRAVDNRDVFVTPAADLALFDQIVAGIGAAPVDEAARRIFGGNGPLCFLGGPNPMAGGEEVLAEAGREQQGKRPDQAALAWPYADFGPAGSVVERREEADLGVTMLRFANGVRLTVKPTKFHADQILVALSLGHGRQDLPADRATPLWAAESGALIGGGLQALSLPEIERVLAGRRAGARFELNDNAFALIGATRPADFELELQLMGAYLTAPGWRPEAFESVRNRMIAALPQLQASPIGVFQRNGAYRLHDGDKRWLAPDLTALQAARLEDLRGLLGPVLAEAPIEAVVVGDVTVERTIAAMAATIGALPPRAPETAPPDAARRVRFPAGGGEPAELRHKGRADQGLALAAWPAADLFGDLRLARHVRLLQLVMQQRLTDEFRTRLGGTYSPGSEIKASGDYPGYGLIMAWAETPADRMATFDETLGRIAADLRDAEISSDEFERARKPRLETLIKSQQTNEYWLSALLRAQTDGKALAIIRTLVPDMQAATAADVRAAASSYLNDDRLWRMHITAESASN